MRRGGLGLLRPHFRPRSVPTRALHLLPPPHPATGVAAAAAAVSAALGAALACGDHSHSSRCHPMDAAAAQHGLLGESHTIEANGVALKFAKEEGAEKADAEVGGEGVWTGRFLWASGGELAQFCAAKPPEFWEGKRVCELGAGCGLVGLTVAAMGAKETVLTDQVTEGAASNLAANASAAPGLEPSRCRVAKLRWGVPEDYPAVAPPFDVIVGSDVLQEGGDIVGDYGTLAGTIGALSGPRTEVYLCSPISNPMKMVAFFDALKAHGFKSKVLKPPLGFDPVRAPPELHQPSPRTPAHPHPTLSLRLPGGLPARQSL